MELCATHQKLWGYNLVRRGWVFCHRWLMSQMITAKQQDKAIQFKSDTTGGQSLNLNKLLTENLPKY